MGDKLFAWHYTTGENFKRIIESGVLLPTAVGITQDEKPILWFSIEQFWEPTAQKSWLQDGESVLLGMQGTFERGFGLTRFGLSKSRLVAWPRLAKVANMRAGVRRALEREARSQGAIPEYWCGLAGESLSIEEVEAIDVFDGNQWVPVR